MDKQELTIKMQKHLRALSAGPKKTPKVYPKTKFERPVTAVGNKQDSRQHMEEFLRRPHLKVSVLSSVTADDSKGFIELDTNTTSPVTMVQSIGLDLDSVEEQAQSVPRHKTVTAFSEKDRALKSPIYSTLLAWQTELKTEPEVDSIEDVDLSDRSTSTHNEADPSGKEKYKNCCKYYEVEPISYLARHMGDTVVQIKHRCIATNMIKPMALALQINTLIQVLDLTDNHIDSVGAEHLAHMLKENQTLVNLNMSNNRIESKGLEAICNMLEINTTLKVLSLAGNHLNDKDGHLLINPLKNNSSLTSLDLSQNEFSITGAICIGRALVVNEGLIDLDLSWNSIRRQGAVAIANGIRVNKTLERIDLSWNGFGTEGAIALQRSLSVNRTLKMLDLSNNRLNDDAVEKLCFGLRKNLTLETLSLNRNPVTDEVFQIILKLIERHQSLSFLSLEGLVISKSSHEMLRKLKNFSGKFILHGDIGSLNKEKVLESLGQWFEHFKKSRSDTLNDVIRQFDLRSKGVITTDEMKFCLRSAGFHLPKGYMDLLVQSLDSDHTCLIKYREMFQPKSQTNEGKQFPLLMNTELEDIDGEV